MLQFYKVSNTTSIVHTKSLRFEHPLTLNITFVKKKEKPMTEHSIIAVIFAQATLRKGRNLVYLYNLSLWTLWKNKDLIVKGI